MQAIVGLSALLAQHPEVADAGHQAMIEPRTEANRILIGRAITRGEAKASADVETIAQVIPSMGEYRSLIQRRAFNSAFLVGLLDNVPLPALAINPSHFTACFGRRRSL